MQHKFQFRFTERMKLSRVLHVNSNRFYVIPFCCWNSQKVTTLLVFKLTLEPSEESRTHANVLHELPTWLTWIIFLCANLCIILQMPIFLTCRKVHTHTHTHTTELSMATSPLQLLLLLLLLSSRHLFYKN